MVMLSAVRYFCSLHPAEVVLEKVYYNCFERGNPHSTLIEMRPLLEMQAVASEIELLLAYGVANPLAARLGALLRQLKSEEASRFPELTKKARGQKMRESEEANPALGILKALFSQLQAFSSVIGINHTPCAARVVQALCELAESAEREFAREHKILRYLGRALGVMRVELQNLLPADANPLWGWHIALSRWCLKRGLVQQAITHATELIPTRCCEEAGLDPLDLKNRLAFGESVTALSPHISGERKPPRDWEPILQSWNSVREHRNRVNHSYTSGSTEGDPSADERKIQAAVEKLLRVVEATRSWPGCKIDFSPKKRKRPPKT
jgi:hypothetical protein